MDKPRDPERDDAPDPLLSGRLREGRAAEGIRGVPEGSQEPGHSKYSRKAYKAEYTVAMNRTLAPNGLAYRPMFCTKCHRHLGDEAILMGTYRKPCPNCGKPFEQEYNRIGEAQDTLGYIQEMGGDISLVDKKVCKTPDTP